DPGWEHGIDVDSTNRRVQCKYCGVIRSGGVYRLKHHLAGTSCNVEACPNVPEEVKQKFIDLLRTHTEESQKKKRSRYGIDDDNDDDEVEQVKKRKGKNTMDCFVTKTKTKNQTTINQIFKKQERDDVCQQICRFLYTSAFPFNCVNNPEFAKMVAMIGKYGVGLKQPSYHEVRETFLKKEVLRTMEMLEEYKVEWSKTGCTIMSDGWTDKKRSICNFLVNSPKGTVFLASIDTSDISKTSQKVFDMLDYIVERVGEENVVQVVTDNAANYKLAGEYLMEKRKHLFWTPCAAHCIDLILEDFEKKLDVHRVTIEKGRRITTYIYSRTLFLIWLKDFTKWDLIRPALTRFAMSYLTLGCLNENKGALISMFASDKWKSSRFVKADKGKSIESIVMDTRGFWPNVASCLKGALPLIKVLRMVDSDDKPAMGFIYEEMDLAKAKIHENFNNVKKSYERIWSIIDQRWESQLRRPLHATAYFLNPHYHYSPNFKVTVDVKIGLYKCLERMIPDATERVKIDMQIDLFKNAKGLFGIESAVLTRKKKSPGDWWDSYGDECPELKRFAIRVLSLTCSSFGCERNWSAFEMVHTKRRNRFHQQKMNDLVFVMYNLKLKEREAIRDANKVEKFYLDDISSDDEWITEKESLVLPERGRLL
ncbi:LOW QUALITY PROTEIN: zf-BED domain-containing protein/DUF659 domain-containing protein/Dimer_Tnp_hAT domain-containing protein, partial [Cephalotus follicularis]